MDGTNIWKTLKELYKVTKLSMEGTKIWKTFKEIYKVANEIHNLKNQQEVMRLNNKLQPFKS